MYALSSSFHLVFIGHLCARCATIGAGSAELDKIQMLPSWDLQTNKRHTQGVKDYIVRHTPRELYAQGNV